MVLKDNTNAATGIPEDLVGAIQELKKKKRAVIMAHFYQEPAIQDIADYIGDSLGLAQNGEKSDAGIIVLAGVLFMGETAKILNPEKKVLVPDMAAGCSLADNCPADKYAEFIKDYPDHVKITYVNCSAEVKALSDILCTSSNALKIVDSVPREKSIVFAPDQHLGRYIMKKSGRELVLWQGACEVHETFDAKKIVQLTARHPGALVVAHPECPEAVLEFAQFIGSTNAMLKFVQQSPAKEFIVVTESGILHQMRKFCPEKTFHAAPNSEDSCGCANCPYMKRNTMEKIYLCLQNEAPEVLVSEDVRQRALIPIRRMLELS